MRRVDPTRYPRRSDARSLLQVGAHLLLVLAPLLLAARLGPGLHLLPLWLWFGLTMNPLLNLLHEAAHGLVFRQRGADRLLGVYLLAPLSLADFDRYRDRHFDHHRHLGQARDPKYTYRVGIHGPALARLCWRSLTLAEARQRFRQQTNAPLPRATLLRTALLQGGLLLALTAAALTPQRSAAQVVWAVALAYGLVYGYGLAALTVLLSALRGIAEHRSYNDSEPLVGVAVLRNLRCGWLERLVLGAYGFTEHATHHLEPAIPCYHLPQVTRRLAQEDEALIPGPGYLQTLRRL